MKVVVTGTRGIPGIMGGVETHCENLFPLIAKKGYDITIVCRSSYVKKQLDFWEGIRLVNIKAPKKKAFEAFVHTFRAVNYAAKTNTDIVHINATGPALLVPYAKMRGLKVVFTHHGPDYDRQKWGKLAKMMLRLGEKFGCKYADQVIVISNVIKKIIADKYGRTENVSLIYNGVPEPVFCDWPEYFEELGIEKGKYVFAFGRFVKEKRFHDLIEAFHNSNLSEKGYRLVIAGDADFEDAYSTHLKSIAKENNVVLTGFIKGRKLQSLLSGAALFVLPSSYEGLPIALLEAMSYKLPLVVSDIPANLEVGLEPQSYFETGNIKQLSKMLEERYTLGRINYNMEKYRWEKIAEETEGVYNRLYELS